MSIDVSNKQWLSLKASAGSGKTFALAMRYISLLFSEANPNEILTLTFTKKAAAEMNRRITANLKKLKTIQDVKSLHADLKPFLDELATYGITQEYVRENIDRIYAKFLRSNVKIVTIDAFLNSILRKFCWHASVSHYFDVISSENREEIDNCFLSSLTSKEQEEFRDFCIESNMASATLLDLLYKFDLKYFNLQDYINDDLIFPQVPQILTLARKIQAVVLKRGETKRATEAIKADNIDTLVTSTLTWLKDGGDYLYFKKLKIESLEPFFEELREKLVEYFRYNEMLALKKIVYFLKIYKKSRQKNYSNALSFDIIALKTYQLLQDQANMDFFYFRLDDRIRHILIDEFQDTSIIQYKILEPIISEILSGEGRIKDRSIFFVGDTKQSIYRFRGANSELFDYASKNISQENLKFNYRSSPHIISFINDVFRRHFENYVPQIFPPDKNNSNGTEGYVKVCKISEELEGFKESILHNIQILLEAQISLEDIVILCFSNEDTLTIKNYLATWQPFLPVITENSAKLIEQLEVKIIIEVLSYINSDFSNKEFHKKNILKLSGLKFSDDIELPKLGAYQSLSSYILKVMQTLELYSDAAQKLLEISCDYDDFAVFLENIQCLDIDFQEETQKGLRIMTIHKSKGLEFPYVILCDRIKGENRSAEKILPSYQGIELQRIFYNESNEKKRTNRGFFDPSYRVAREKNKFLEEREKINRLYVAFTRAEKGLIIVGKKPAKGEKSAFEVLEFLDKESIIGALSPSAKHSIDIDPSPIIISQKSFGRQEDFIHQNNEKEMGNYIDIVFGEALHKALEYDLGYGVAEEENSHILLNQYGFFLSQKSLERIHDLKDRLKKDSDFRAFISGGSIKSEIPYLWRNTLHRIDALIFDKDGRIIILDYKSGVKNKEKNQEQVKKYLDFVENQVGDRHQVEAYLLYVREKIEFVRVS